MTRTYRIYAVYDLEDPAKDCNEFGHDGLFFHFIYDNLGSIELGNIGKVTMLTPSVAREQEFLYDHSFGTLIKYLSLSLEYNSYWEYQYKPIYSSVDKNWTLNACCVLSPSLSSQSIPKRPPKKWRSRITVDSASNWYMLCRCTYEFKRINYTAWPLIWFFEQSKGTDEKGRGNRNTRKWALKSNFWYQNVSLRRWRTSNIRGDEKVLGKISCQQVYRAGVSLLNLKEHAWEIEKDKSTYFLCEATPWSTNSPC